ncbi:MAG: phosphatase PAP2 family protein [Chloroflexi bacterium]|jgi:membrane-associated phospholipid phosphatase|nr:phosphatase PAP2 family protein [Chloroflexota bacterium]
MHDLLWDLIPWGYRLLLLLEGYRTGFLDVAFQIITDVGSEMGYIFIVTLLYWCFDKSIGQGISYIYMFTATVNSWLKHIWLIPRPGSIDLEATLQQAGIDARLAPLRESASPAFPSGHTQTAVVGWGYMAARFRRLGVWILALVMMILIGFSRLYLGVHFPQDVIAGALFGAAMLLLWLPLEPRVRAWLAERPLWQRYALAIGAPLAALPVLPISDTATPLGAIIGLGIGFVTEGETVNFSVRGPAWRRALRALAGWAIVIPTYFGLSWLFGHFDTSMGAVMELVWRVIRYGLTGFVGAWVAPWLFLRLGLAEKETACKD